MGKFLEDLALYHLHLLMWIYLQQSGMLLLGGVCGGYATAYIGIEACFGKQTFFVNLDFIFTSSDFLFHISKPLIV